MKEMVNVYNITITFKSVKPSLHELWDEIRSLRIVPTYVDIQFLDKYEIGG